MKKIYRYSEYVHICRIELDKKDNCRYLAEYNLDYGEKNKIALVIMKNPSYADSDESDQTINKVLKCLHNFKYSKVFIANLIPIYGTDSDTIPRKELERQDLMDKNIEFISEILKMDLKIFVGWGERKHIDKQYYDKRIKSVLDIIGHREIYCYKSNKSGNPIHPSRNQWKEDKSENEYEILNG